MQQGCNACTWIHVSFSNKIQRNCGTQKNPVHAQLGQILYSKDTKRPKNTTATFEQPRAKIGYCADPLHTGRAKRPVARFLPSAPWASALTFDRQEMRPRAQEATGVVLGPWGASQLRRGPALPLSPSGEHITRSGAERFTTPFGLFHAAHPKREVRFPIHR